MEVALILIASAVLVYIIWRSTRTDRDAFERDEAVLPLLSPLAIRLAGHQDVSEAEIDALAGVSHARPVLYEMLVHYGHTELFPTRYTTIDAQSEGILAHAAMHPNVNGEPPFAIEIQDAVVTDIDGRTAEFRVLRMKLKDDDRSGGDLPRAVVGPFFADAIPYLNEARAMFGASADAFIKREMA